MTDIFQEVEEDLRRERIKRVWDRYGIVVIVAAVLVVALTAGWRGYVAWENARSAAAGDRFLAALDGDGSADADALAALAADGPSGYALLARFRLATAEGETGDAASAVAGFDAIAADGGVAEVYRDLARVRAGLVLVDEGDPAGARERVAGLAERGQAPFAGAAREVMGLAAFAEDDLADARSWFREIEGDAAAPAGLRGRARLMLAVIDGRLPDEGAAAPAADEAAAGGEAIR